MESPRSTLAMIHQLSAKCSFRDRQRRSMAPMMVLRPISMNVAFFKKKIFTCRLVYAMGLMARRNHKLPLECSFCHRSKLSSTRSIFKSASCSRRHRRAEPALVVIAVSKTQLASARHPSTRSETIVKQAITETHSRALSTGTSSPS